ncbi:CotY/CotZ family spore coat protein [Pseudalkalibacillus caeni]|uniref:Spore coat protein n=1 Tax=Exobacillus caeni TaxID=2574798 RepID=A0A5R9EWE0_9BACL|nr:CotY/CotZ family spore coat protein [Pseudalkalibacillus caeni]TLS35357.1 hypothetical protein FCL54_20945 [Pseudalkalibacillus caeni]
MNGCGNDRCVCEVVRKIATLQMEAAGDSCTTGCDSAFKQLLGGMPSKDTIPFSLTSKYTCKVVCAKAYVRTKSYTYDVKKIKSEFFRVSKFLDDEKCCAVLELLCPVPCDENPDLIETFRRTGACVTVDLDCFCAITCFPAIRAARASEEDLESCDCM